MLEMFEIFPKYKKGFTLIEVMVSISIFAMLSSVVLTAVNRTRIKASNARIQEQIFQIRNAIELGYSGSLYRDLVSDVGSANASVARLNYSQINQNLVYLVNDILKNNQAYYGGSESPATCGPSQVRHYCVDNGNGYSGAACGGGSPETNRSLNGLTIFTNNPTPNGQCNTPGTLASRYAVFGAYNPVGSGGYFCLDHRNNVVHKTTGYIPEAPGPEVTCI